MLIAKETVNTGVAIFKPGDEVTGLEQAEMERLVQLGAASVSGEFPPSKTLPPERPELKAFRAVVESMVKKDKVEYAGKAGVDGLKETMTTDEMTNLLLVDAENGVDIESLTDAQLELFAEQLGISFSEESRDERMTIIEQKLQG